MHIKNNVFEYIFNIVINIKGKTKDNIKARIYMTLFCDYQNIELLSDGIRVTKPKLIFALDKKK